MGEKINENQKISGSPLPIFPGSVLRSYPRLTVSKFVAPPRRKCRGYRFEPWPIYIQSLKLDHLSWFQFLYVELKQSSFQELGELPDFELPDVLPDLPGVAQNLAFVNDLTDLPDIPFFEPANKSGNSQRVSSEASAVLQQLPPPEALPEVRSTAPLPPTEAPPDLPPLPDPEPIPDLPMASKPVQQKSSDEPGWITKILL